HAGSHQQDVAGTDVNALRGKGGVEIGGSDRITRLEPVDAAGSRQIHQDAASRYAAGDLLDAQAAGPAARHLVRIVAVIELAIEEAVAERVPLRRALQRHDD